MDITYLLILSLSLVIVGILYYLYLYRHPIVLNLSANPSRLLSTPLEYLPQTKQLLKNTHRLDAILVHNDVPLQWLERAISFINLPNLERTNILAARLNGSLDENDYTDADLFTLCFGNNFLLNLTQCFVYFPPKDLPMQEVLQRLNQYDLYSPTVVISMDLSQQRSLRPHGENFATRWVVLNSRELTALLLHPKPVKIFVSLLAQQLAVVHLSPYITKGGINKESAFFGREQTLAHILNRDPANYLIIGGRQLGKSSLLKRIHRHYQNNQQIWCHYCVLAVDNLQDSLAIALELPKNTSLDELLMKLGDVFPKKYRLLLIDEADEFIHQEIKDDYPILRFFRSLSEQRLCFFIFAGFWNLYETAVSDYQSPLKNFGESLIIKELEIEACRKLATEPLALLGIRYTSPELIERIITATGQRANLIAIVCNEMLQHLVDRQRKLDKKDVERALKSPAVREALDGWKSLTSDGQASCLDRIIVYITVKAGKFNSRAIVSWFNKRHLSVTPQQLQQSLTRLELAFVIRRDKENYRYCVPLFRTFLLEQDIEFLLKQELIYYPKIH